MDDHTTAAVTAIRAGAPLPEVPTKRQQDALDMIAERIAIIRAETMSLDRWVIAARAEGASWADIGLAAGMTKQAAWARWADGGHPDVEANGHLVDRKTSRSLA